MDEITRFVKDEILSQYRSIRQFSEKTGIGERKITLCLSKGILQSKYKLVTEICRNLGIQQDFDHGIRFYGIQFREMQRRLSCLDHQAIERIRMTVEREYERCKGSNTENDCSVSVPLEEL